MKRSDNFILEYEGFMLKGLYQGEGKLTKYDSKMHIVS